MKRIDVHAGPAAYPYLVGAGVLRVFPDDIPLIADRAALIYDEQLPPGVVKVATTTLETAGIDVLQLPVVSGEQAKSMQTAERLAGAMAAGGIHRTDLVAGLGGGAATDLAGFVAALYHRGIEFIAMPTTLLGMVDASVGGKTAVNLAEGKNLVGVFHQPLAVIADVETLVTLPDAELRSGMAEVIKHGLIADPGLLSDCTSMSGRLADRDADALTHVVARAVNVKVQLVEQDPTELEQRAFLNYGHTLGHAIEAIGHAGAGPLWRHGEAVAIGMMFAANLAVSLGHSDRIADHASVITAAGLPVEGAEVEFETVMAAMMRDKKYKHGLRFVVLEDLAQPRIVSGVDEDVLRACYEAVR